MGRLEQMAATLPRRRARRPVRAEAVGEGAPGAALIITWNNDGDRADLVLDGVCLLQCRCSGDLRPALRVPGRSAAWSTTPGAEHHWIYPPATADRADIEAAMRQEAEVRIARRMLDASAARMHGTLRVLEPWKVDGPLCVRKWGAVPIVAVMKTAVTGYLAYYPEAARPNWTPIRGAVDLADARELVVQQLMALELYHAPELTP